MFDLKYTQSDRWIFCTNCILYSMYVCNFYCVYLYVRMYVCTVGMLYLLCIYVWMYVYTVYMYVLYVCITLRRIDQMSQGPGLICMCMCMYVQYVCLHTCNYNYFLPGFRRRVSWNTMHMPSACGHAPFQLHLIFQTRRKN